MRKFLILCACLCGCIVAFSQAQLKYSRVNVDLTTGDPRDFVKGGFDLEHGLYLPNRLYISDMSEVEIQSVLDMGFDVKVLIEDMQEHYVNQSADRSQPECQEYDYQYKVPENFRLGSMGGFLTYQQMIDELDLMAHFYPGLITPRQQVGSELTHEGRKVEWVRISDNASSDENEPEVLYTALHHAREPISMMQMIYYMWYLLENYETSAEIKYLVNNTELYFVPCVNPDGYVYNHSIAPNGGGNWRKNKRDNNNDGQFTEKDDGVDLNRNYAYEWGADDEGSSANPSSITYRGETPFSEPETKSMRDFIEERNFVCALNYHAYGNFLLYPWGFNGTSNPDSTAFVNYGDLLTSRSGYGAGTTEETLGYLANGVAEDWMYAMHDVMAVTPELGDADWGFWPPESEIVNLCNTSLFKNLSLAHFTQKFAVAVETSEDFLEAQEGKLNIHVKRFGMEEGSMALSVESLSSDLTILGSLQEIDLDIFAETTFAFDYLISDDATHADEFAFLIKLDNGFYEVRDTIFKTYGTIDIPFADAGESVDDWDIAPGSTWGVSDEEAVSGETSLTDSPYSFYTPDAVTEMTLTEPIDLTEALNAELTFMAKWDIEDIIDYAVIEASSDGINFSTLCGKHSTAGSIFQRFGAPIYDGQQDDWVTESISLEDFLGTEIYIRFALYTDAYFELDGIYIDDIAIKVFGEDSVTTSSVDLLKTNFSFSQFPNPASDLVTIQYDLTEVRHKSARVEITDILGRRVHMATLPSHQRSIRINTADWTSGMYTTSIVVDGQLLQSDRLVLAR